MSLTSFLKDYFVNPLVRKGAMRFGVKRMVPIFLSVSIANFLIIGLWHGWGAQYLSLGIAHALGFVIYWLYDRYIGKKLAKPLKQHWAYSSAATVLTIGWISFATSFIFVDLSFWHKAWGL